MPDSSSTLAAEIARLPFTEAAETDAREREELSGLEKAAIFIRSLDEEVASQVLRNLPDDEAEKITRQIAGVGAVSREQIARVIGEFSELSRVQEFIRRAGVGQAVNQNVPFSFLGDTRVESLHAFLQDEHPQTIALVLSHAEPPKTAEVLGRFTPDRQFDIAKRIANLGHSSPEAIQQVESRLHRHLSSLDRGTEGDCSSSA